MYVLLVLEVGMGVVEEGWFTCSDWLAVARRIELE